MMASRQLEAVAAFLAESCKKGQLGINQSLRANSCNRSKTGGVSAGRVPPPPYPPPLAGEGREGSGAVPGYRDGRDKPGHDHVGHEFSEDGGHSGLSRWAGCQSEERGRMRTYQSATYPHARRKGMIASLARIGGAFGLMLVASGCLETGRPGLAVDIPDVYRASHGPPEAATPALDWWRSFRSPELTSLMEEALAAHFDIAVAIAQITQADAQVRIAGAPLLPTIDLNASDTASKRSEQLSTSGRAGGGSPFSRLYATSLSASYVIDFLGHNRSALNAAIETSIASRYNREVVTITALTTVADTYFQILAALDRLRIARRNLTDSSRILYLIKQQFEVGTASDLNVAQQESLVEQVRATIPPLEETLRQDIAALAVLVGKAPDHFNARGGGMQAITVPRVTPGLPSELMNRRQDGRHVEQQP